MVTVPSSVKNQSIRNGILRHHNFSRHIFSGKTQKVLCGLTLSVVWSNTVCPFSQLTFCVLSMMLYKNVSSFIRVFTILPYQARARRTKARGSASTRECSGWNLFCQLNLRYCLATFVTKLTNPWIHRKTGFRETKWLLPSDCRKDVFFNWVSYRSNSSLSFWSLFAEGESVKVRLHERFCRTFLTQLLSRSSCSFKSRMKTSGDFSSIYCRDIARFRTGLKLDANLQAFAENV